VYICRSFALGIVITRARRAMKSWFGVIACCSVYLLCVGALHAQSLPLVRGSHHSVLLCPRR
jgi:hypothetical protein